MNNYQKYSTKDKGKDGESIAIKYLQNKNYKIIKRNFFFGKVGEIDIIAEDNNTLVFIEVKTRNSFLYGDPLESITSKKQNILKRVAEGFLYINKIYNKECRFDVICIENVDGKEQLKHLVNAF